MADLTQVIRALQYGPRQAQSPKGKTPGSESELELCSSAGPLFDMMDRRTGAALLFVNKEISNMVTAYIKATDGFKSPAFEVYKDHCIIRYNNTVLKILTSSNVHGFIKCSFTITTSMYGLLSYAIHFYNCKTFIAETIGIDKQFYQAVISSYKDYENQFKDWQKYIN